MENLKLNQYKEYLKPRPKAFFKGDAGHVLIVGGESGYSGATILAAVSALRVGAGLVTLATKVEHAAFLNATRPEIMCRGIKDASELQPLFERATVIVVGPGLGQTSWSIQMLNAVLGQNKNLLVDADALNLIAKKPEKRNHWILTPHPGEAARLLKTSVEIIQNDRKAAAAKIQQEFGGVCVLKGSGTLVKGEGDISICELGNPGMATAGMGDVLSGIIGGFLAQKIPLEPAAKMGVVVHAAAGDKASERGQRGMIASDLIEHLREFVNG